MVVLIDLEPYDIKWINDINGAVNLKFQALRRFTDPKFYSHPCPLRDYSKHKAEERSLESL
jgi:hypothetical protein